MPIIIVAPETDGRTFLELQNATLGDSFDSAKYRARVKGWLNEALGRITRVVALTQRNGTAEVPLVVGQNNYALPARVARVFDMYSKVDGYRLDMVDAHEIDEMTSLTGRPTVYAVAGRDLLVAPTPTAVETFALRYRDRPAAMVADTDLPGIHTDWDDILVVYAKAKCYREEDDKEMHDALMKDFRDDLASFRIDQQDMFDTEPRQVEGCW